MNQLLKPLLWKSAWLYALFLLPTCLLLVYAATSDADLSRHVSEAWEAGFWHFPGLTSKSSRIITDILEIGAILGLTLLYLKGFRVLNQTSAHPNAALDGETQRTVLAWVLLCGGLLVAVIPFHSSDLYGYLNRGFQQTVHHTNPYLTPVVEIPGWEKDPLLHPHWIYNPCPYGFFFAQLTAWFTGWAGLFFWKAFLLFKGLNWLLLAGTTFLTGEIAQRLNRERPWLSAYLFGASPLVLLHVMGNGHNDILLVFLLLLALRMLFTARFQFLALPFLLLSILTKYASLLALPFFVIVLYRRKNYAALGVGLLLSILITLALALPYIAPSSTLDASNTLHWHDLLDNAGKSQHSLVAMLVDLVCYPAKWLHGPVERIRDQLLHGLKPVFWLGFIFFYAVTVFRFIKTNAMNNPDETPVDLEALIEGVGWSMTVMVVLVSAKFHPWYPVMFLSWLLLLPEGNRLRQAGLMFGLFQIAGFTVFQNLPVVSVLMLTILPVMLAWKGKSIFNPANADF